MPRNPEPISHPAPDGAGPALVLVSACLAGLPTRYDAASAPDPEVMGLVARGLALPLCPEQLGGLPTPRPAARIVGGDGEAVAAGRARVLAEDGCEVTRAFLQGAAAMADLAGRAGCRQAILKSLSPSCATGLLKDQQGSIREGWGVAAAQLRRLGLECRAEGASSA